MASSGSIIYSSDFNSIASAVNTEVNRRGHGNPGYTAPGTGAVINHTYINNLWGAITGMTGTNPATNPVGSYFSGTSNNYYYQSIGTVGNGYPFAGYSNSGIFNGVSANAVISASDINNLVSFISTAASQCLCNCNYCTCNCNYCTCNCNYWCTCNCNYSDQRLKENIILIGEQEGLNIYSFTYRWDNKTVYKGVMAQELVDTKYASALGTDKDGFYYVDYSQLPITFEEV